VPSVRGHSSGREQVSPRPNAQCWRRAQSERLGSWRGAMALFSASDLFHLICAGAVGCNGVDVSARIDGSAVAASHLELACPAAGSNYVTVTQRGGTLGQTELLASPSSGRSFQRDCHGDSSSAHNARRGGSSPARVRRSGHRDRCRSGERSTELCTGARGRQTLPAPNRGDRVDDFGQLPVTQRGADDVMLALASWKPSASSIVADQNAVAAYRR